MAAKNSTADGDESTKTSATKDDLLNVVPSTGFRVTSNNEKINVYPDPTDTAHGVIEHTYAGWPAKGIVLYDITGYDIVDARGETGAPDEDETLEEMLEGWEPDIRDWLDGVLFDSSMGSTEGNCKYVDTHTIEISNPWEDETYTVELETENKRRVR